MNKGDIIYLKRDVQEAHTTEVKVLTKGCGYEVTHVGLNYVSVYCWVNGICKVYNEDIDFSEIRNGKIDKLLDEG